MTSNAPEPRPTTDPVLADPIAPDPAIADAVVPDPGTVDPVIADAVVTDPIITDPMLADPKHLRASDRARRNATDVDESSSPAALLRTGGYATIGVADAAVSYLRRLPALAGELRDELPDPRRLGDPRAVTSSLRQIGADIENRVDTLAGRGREVVTTLRRSVPTRMAASRTRTAANQAGMAANQVRTAAGQVRTAAGRARVAGEQARSAVSTARRAGSAGGDAVEQAAATVGTPDAVDYATMTSVELRGLARECDIDGRSDMNKAELVAALRRSDIAG